MSQWAAEMLISTAVLMALVLLLRRPVARYFGARAAFALWLAPLLRFVLPSLAQPIDAPHIWIETSAAAVSTMAPVSAAVPLGTLLVTGWIGGTMLFLACHVIAYRRFVAAALVGASAVTEPGIDDAAILASDAVTGPAASGLLIRRIFVPRDFKTEFSPEEQRLALTHEALHHRRGDLWASAAALVCLSLHWFNPLAYVAHRAFRRDLEATCDADLLAHADAATRQAYARTILRCVARPVPNPICALTDCDELKGRIRMLNHNHGLFARTVGMLIAASASVCGVAFALPAVAAPQDSVGSGPSSYVKIVRIDGTAGGSNSIPAEVKKCVGDADPLVTGDAATRANQPVRIVLCDKSGARAAPNAESLEKALSRIEGNQELPAARKAQIVAALKTQIAALRGVN